MALSPVLLLQMFGNLSTSHRPLLRNHPFKRKSAKRSDPSCASVGFRLTVNGSNRNGVGVLLADVNSITLFQAGCGKKPSMDESGIINSFMTADGYHKYNVNSNAQSERRDLISTDQSHYIFYYRLSTQQTDSCLRQEVLV
jgi:hypothetical protein